MQKNVERIQDIKTIINNVETYTRLFMIVIIILVVAAIILLFTKVSTPKEAYWQRILIALFLVIIILLVLSLMMAMHPILQSLVTYITNVELQLNAMQKELSVMQQALYKFQMEQQTWYSKLSNFLGFKGMIVGTFDEARGLYTGTRTGNIPTLLTIAVPYLLTIARYIGGWW